MKNKQNPSSGINFASLLFLLFLGLKLTHYIDWPWVWVFSPLWIPAVLSVLLFIIINKN